MLVAYREVGEYLARLLAVEAQAANGSADASAAAAARPLRILSSPYLRVIQVRASWGRCVVVRRGVSHGRNARASSWACVVSAG